MPKTSARKKSSAAWNEQHIARNVEAANGMGMSNQAGVQAGPTTGSASMMSLIMPAMVALGCWGMAFTFTVLSTTDPNHLLFGGMAALMALMWSVSFGIRVRKVLRQK